MTITYYFEPYMVPVGLLLIFLKHYLVTSYIGNTTNPPITASLILFCLKFPVEIKVFSVFPAEQGAYQFTKKFW
jgi:hypothetical protein